MKKKGLASLLTAIAMTAGMAFAVPASADTMSIEPAAVAAIGGWYDGGDGDRETDYREIRLGGVDSGVVGAYNNSDANAESKDCKVSFLRFDLDQLSLDDSDTLSLTLIDGNATRADRAGNLNIYAAVADMEATVLSDRAAAGADWNTADSGSTAVTWYTRPTIGSATQVKRDISGKGDILIDVTDIFKSNGSFMSGNVTIALLGEKSGDTSAEYIYKNATLAKSSTTVVAKIGDAEYTSLGTAMDNGAGKTVTVLADTTLDASDSVNNYSGGSNGTMTVSAVDNDAKTITMINTEKELLIWDGFEFNYINFVSGADTVKSLAKAQNNKQGTFKMNNSSVKNVTFDSYLSGFGSLQFNNTEISGNTTTTDVFLARNTGTLTDTTITGNTANSGSDSVIYLTNTDADITFTVTDSTINNNTAAYDIEIVPVGHSITVNLAGTSQVGSINNTKGGTIVLKSGFTGSAEIVPTSTAIDTVVATVEEGAQTSDITVEGLDTNTYELVVNENDQLVIAEKSGETKMTRVTFGGNPDQGEISEDGEKFTVGDTVATAWKGTIEKSTKGETLSITATQDTKSVTNEYDVPGGEAGSVEAESVFYVLVDAVVDAMTFIIK